LDKKDTETSASETEETSKAGDNATGKKNESTENASKDAANSLDKKDSGTNASASEEASNDGESTESKEESIDDKGALQRKRVILQKMLLKMLLMTWTKMLLEIVLMFKILKS